MHIHYSDVFALAVIFSVAFLMHFRRFYFYISRLPDSLAMTSLPVSISAAARKRYALQKVFMFSRGWREMQRLFDARAVYEVSEYYRQWSAGKRYVVRPEKSRIDDVFERTNEACLEQVCLLVALSSASCRTCLLVSVY